MYHIGSFYRYIHEIDIYRDIYIYIYIHTYVCGFAEAILLDNSDHHE